MVWVGVGGACVQGRVSKTVARTSKPKVLEMFRHSQEDRTLSEAGSKMSNYVSTALARADRGSDPPEKHKKDVKNDRWSRDLGMLDFEAFAVAFWMSFLSLKSHRKSHCGSLWAPWVAILAFFLMI